MGISFLFSFSFYFSLASAVCKASSDNHFAFLHFFFLGMVLIPACCTMFFIYSSINGHLVCFHILALVNNSAMNISSKFAFPLCIYQEVGLLDYMVVLFLIFWGKPIHILIMSAPIYIPLNSAQNMLYSTSFSALLSSVFEFMLCLVAQSCPTLCDLMDCGLQGSCVCGNSPCKNTGVDCHAFLQGILPTQRLNPGLPHCRWILYWLSYCTHTHTYY